MLTGYQVTWLCCVFGEIIFESSVLGLISGTTFILSVFLLSKNKKKLTFIVFSISFIGYLFDSILVNLNIYSFNTSLYLGLLPIWMIVLWPSFAVLFDEIFVFLSKYKFIAIVLSGSLGPLTYYTGYPLGLINIGNLTIFFILMIIFWMSLMFFYLNFLLKIKTN